MIILKVISLIILIQTVEILADCTFTDFEKDAPPIFLEPFGKNHLIVDFEDSVFISDGSYIEAFCSLDYNWKIEAKPVRIGYDSYHDRQLYENRVSTTIKIKEETIRIYCNSYEMTYTDTDDIPPMPISYNLTCNNNKPRFYENPVEDCNGTGFLYAHNIKDIPIVYAELCFNTDDMIIEFWHYVAAKRSKILEKQAEIYPTDLALNLSMENTAAFSNWKIKNENPFVPVEIDMTDFEYHNLLLLPNFDETFMTKEIDLIAWWTPLRTNNWRTLRKLIKKQILIEDFEIYEGISGDVIFPNVGQCNSSEMKKLSDESGRTPPLYIWKYMKPRENPADLGFVIIGINSPFVESPPKQICDDICDSISWLQPMNKLRKMPAFGYVFCCKADQVYKELTGFPPQ